MTISYRFIVCGAMILSVLFLLLGLVIGNGFVYSAQRAIVSFAVILCAGFGIRRFIASVTDQPPPLKGSVIDVSLPTHWEEQPPSSKEYSITDGDKNSETTWQSLEDFVTKVSLK